MDAKRYRLLIFDWDGTVADSEARIVQSVQATVNDLGLRAPPTEDVRNVIGLGLRECMEALFPNVSPGRYAGLVEAYRRHFQEQARTPVSLFPDAKPVLESLDSAGYTIAIATGKSRRGLDRELDESGLAEVVSASRCADEAPSKPHPKMLEDVLELTLTDRRAALMIGDTTYDMQMARDAGVDRVAVSYGTHETSRLLEFSPLEVIDSLAALEIWLSSEAMAK